MIDYKVLIKEQTTEVLNEAEKTVLEEIEKFTENKIKDQFPWNGNVNINSSEITKIVKDLGMFRRKIVIAKWIDMCENHNWKVTYESRNDTYDLTGKIE